jgi:primosomal protein N' (replication factor Y)
MSSCLHIAVPCPLRQSFDYLSNEEVSYWQPGMRVAITFRNKPCIGIVLSASAFNEQQQNRNLKYIDHVIDEHSLLPEELFQIILWTSQYYHHPIGDCFATALPKQLRQIEKATLKTENWWQLNNFELPEKLGKKQQQCVDLLSDYEEGLSQSTIRQYLGTVTPALNALAEKGFIEAIQKPILPIPSLELVQAHNLNQQQQHVVDTVSENTHQFKPFLLQGITGSGKTEVYIQLTEKVLANKQQVLILIPEIGLTGQFVERFKERIEGTIVVLHSNISDQQRGQAWLLAQQRLADVIIGTRSAVFTPLTNPGLIIIDEEHDSAYKQQDGLRYHARHIALMRAQRFEIPILMGSATPSLESLHNVEQQRFTKLELTQRAANAQLPHVRVIAHDNKTSINGMSPTLIENIKTHLANDNQVLLFVNRRGFAPVLMCHDCDWQAKCKHCDALMVVHQSKNSLYCHHCGLIQTLPTTCPQCAADDLFDYGVGTEKIEVTLNQLFPETSVLRIDRDTTQRVNAFENMISDIKQGGAKILVGTQMLAKGHDFHDVTLVGILDADQALYSADFRATETLSQLVTQVIGRAGRGKKAGEVYIQSQHPEHEFWSNLIKQGYSETAQTLLKERDAMQLPPVGALCVIRAEAKYQNEAMQLLTEISHLFQKTSQTEVMVMGPAPAIMEKRAGRYRAQLLLSSHHRRYIHPLLDHCLPDISKLKLARKVRWSIDIDPIDLL